MKQTILLILLSTLFTANLHSQKKSQQVIAYAITSPQKGYSNWTDVRLVNITTGQEVQSVYQNNQEIRILNARTKKPIERKIITMDEQRAHKEKFTVHQDKGDAIRSFEPLTRKIVAAPVDDINVMPKLQSDNGSNHLIKRRLARYSERVQTDKPFATSSAACAFDKKHQRLYYTPMGINQLRYIDLNTKSQGIYYFEDEAFGVVKGRRDVGNHITRMVIAADGYGYALSNNAEHFIKFTTNKKAEITDLGALADDATNGTYSIKSPNGFGGDMIAGESGDLYLITAHRAVFRIDIDSKVATYKGNIAGLPRGFGTNGAAVESGSFIIVSSANSTSGYYRFNINDLQAEKISTGEEVFNASDLANGNLLSDRKKTQQGEPQPTTAASAENIFARNMNNQLKISTYPNPVTNGRMNLAFGDVPKGRYMIQFMDGSGKIITSENVAVNFKNQVKELRLPQLMAKGNYLVKVVGEGNKQLSVQQVVVQ